MCAMIKGSSLKLREVSLISWSTVFRGPWVEKKRLYLHVSIDMVFLLVACCLFHCPIHSGNFLKLRFFMCFASLVYSLLKGNIQLVKLAFHFISETTWFVI